jgi:hypothetical protein
MSLTATFILDIFFILNNLIDGRLNFLVKSRTVTL